MRRAIAELIHDAALVTAVDGFDRRLPGARDLRDVREHIRDYIQGSGKLQRPATVPDRLVSMASLSSRIWLGHDELSHFIWAGKEIRLDDALPAAERLYEAMNEAIAPYVVRGGDEQEGIQVQAGSGSRPETTSTGRSSPLIRPAALPWRGSTSYPIRQRCSALVARLSVVIPACGVLASPWK